MSTALESDKVCIDGHAQKITLHSHRPSVQGRPLPLVIYLHGGGFTGGSLEQSDPAAAHLARNVPAWVVSVGYSLAPTFQFPAAHEDAYLALEWALCHAKVFGADRQRVAVVGHEAGGNLAAGLAAIARDRRLELAAQALIMPKLDPSMNHLMAASFPVRGTTTHEIARSYRAYLPHSDQRLHPYAAPLGSRRLTGLPPALIAVASADPLSAEGEVYAAELRRAGVDAKVMTLRQLSQTEINERSPVLRGVSSFLTRHLRIN